ncbi:MAG: glycosyltransferase family 4 protein [Candidatus Terrybacteria bacterium]|nr:glycosyltransferase family 4 protein [Candidatus Terrybacteria bacterium]
MKKLRVAEIVTAAFTAPPPAEVIYAPIFVAIDIACGLSDRGHDVTFFAPQGSHIPRVHIESGGVLPFHASYPEDPEIYRAPDVRLAEREKIIGLWEQRLIAELYRRARVGEFDIIHAHAPDRTLPFASLVPTPTAYTLHTPVMSWHEPSFAPFINEYQHFVSISDAQRRPAQKLPWRATIYNGLDLKKFPFSAKGGEEFLFSGRLIPQKGVREAIDAVRRLGARLTIVGAHGAPKTARAPKARVPSYWESEIAPQLTQGDITYAGLVSYDEIHRFYQTAKATLVPIKWEEPFGLTMIESMACGTPVIAFRRGSVPEIVVDGVTGFIVDTIEEMAEAMKKIDRIDRRACREHVERNFTVERMVDGYEKLFLELTQR